MDTAILLLLVAGLLAVAGVLVVLLYRQGRQRITADSFREELREMSQSVLNQSTETLLTLAGERLQRQSESQTAELDTKKQLIDQRLDQMARTLGEVTSLVNRVEKEREAKASELSTELKNMAEQTKSLSVSTGTLREALSNTRVRGQWGERMAEDVLRVMGLQEGVNYSKQVHSSQAGSRPDFAFYLPSGMRINMDVKFPLDNYVQYLGASTDDERDRFSRAFIRDVHGHISDITGREYIDPEGGTVDYVLLLIPNESVYAFVHEHDPALIDFGLQRRVVCCSPLTLFAVLAIIRQAAENFALRKAEEEVLSLMGRFNDEWKKFKGSVDAVGSRLESAQRAYTQLSGTRARALERPLNRIDALRQQRGIPVAELSSAVPELPSGLDEELDEEDSDQA